MTRSVMAHEGAELDVELRGVRGEAGGVPAGTGW
jgi:hypothetical protein